MFLGRRGCDCTKPRLGQKCRAEHLQRGARLSVRKGSQAVAAASWEPFHLLPLAWGPEKMLCRVAAAQEGKGPLWDVLRSGGAGQVLHGTSCVSAGSWELHFWEPPLRLSFPYGSGLLPLLLLHTGTAETMPWEGRILWDLCALALAFIGLQ